jgi:DNA-binding SARP family transcriptional activator/tetratricopeptide (TPR) repeat protein
VSFARDYTVRLLGPPSLVVEGQPVEFATRKVAALVFYIAANVGRRVDRAVASGLLWSSSTDELARVSLRKALSMLEASPRTAGLIGRDRACVWFAGDPSRCDLAVFNGCLASETERGYREALALWVGQPLAGLEVGEPTFDDWVAGFRADTVGFTHRLLADRLATLAPGVSPRLETALASLVVRIEPSDNQANERLIRGHADGGDTAAAMRQLRAYRSALDELDVPLPASIASLAKELGRERAAADPTDTGRADGDWRPRVMIMQPDGMRPAPDLFSFAHSEILFQLSRFRSMRTLERTDAGPARHTASLVRRIGLTDTVDHDYRLLLWDEPNARAIYLRCLNVRLQQTVSCARMPYELLAERASAERAIAAAVNSIEQDILNDDRGNSGSPFSRWLEAYRHLQLFTPKADETALLMLEDLARDPQGTRLSLVHSSISSILMKQRRLRPGPSRLQRDADRAQDYAQRALVLDPLEPFNHVIQGWLRVQAGEHDRALAAFDDAMALNPTSARTLIASAEARAYCGYVEEARTLAEKAIAFSGRYVPPYFYGYLANINYIVGDLRGCIDALQRAPENLQTALLAIAAYEELGDPSGTAAARVRFERELRRAQPSCTIDTESVSRWIVASNMMRDTGARHRLFRSLERAGVPFNY